MFLTLFQALGGISLTLSGCLNLIWAVGFSTKTRLRLDKDDGTFRRLDTSLAYADSRFNVDLRYYKVDSSVASLLLNPTAPREEISGRLGVKLFDNWSTRYTINHDISNDVTRRQNLSLIYDDNCTWIEMFYARKNNGLGIIEDSNEFGIRIALLTLGSFEPE